MRKNTLKDMAKMDAIFSKSLVWTEAQPHSERWQDVGRRLENALVLDFQPDAHADVYDLGDWLFYNFTTDRITANLMAYTLMCSANVLPI